MEEAFNGEIGHNMFYTKEEREEDVLGNSVSLVAGGQIDNDT